VKRDPGRAHVSACAGWVGEMVTVKRKKKHLMIC